MKEADIKEMFKEASKSISISTNTVFPDPLSPTPSTSSATKTPENIEDNPDDPERAGEGDSQMEYSSDLLYSTSIGCVMSLYVGQESHSDTELLTDLEGACGCLGEKGTQSFVGLWEGMWCSMGPETQGGPLALPPSLDHPSLLHP